MLAITLPIINRNNSQSITLTHCSVAIAGLGLAAWLALCLLDKAPGKYRSCGHYRDLSIVQALNPVSATHDCSAGFVVNDLCTLYSFQELYWHKTNGEYALSLNELASNTYFESDRLNRHGARIVVKENRWHCIVPDQPNLPGAYVLRSGGSIVLYPKDTPTKCVQLLECDDLWNGK